MYNIYLHNSVNHKLSSVRRGVKKCREQLRFQQMRDKQLLLMATLNSSEASVLVLAPSTFWPNEISRSPARRGKRGTLLKPPLRSAPVLPSSSSLPASSALTRQRSRRSTPPGKGDLTRKAPLFGKYIAGAGRRQQAAVQQGRRALPSRTVCW